MQSPDIHWIHPLHRLMATCRESQQRYFVLAREVRDVDLKYLFSSYALQRGKFLAELEIWAGSVGRDEPAEGIEPDSPDEAVNLEELVTKRDEREVFWECLAREEEVLRAYREADEVDIPAELRAILAGHIRDVNAAQSRLRELQLLSEDTG